MNIPEDRGRYPDDPRYAQRRLRDNGDAERADRTRRLLNIDPAFGKRMKHQQPRRSRGTFGYALVGSVVTVAAVLTFRLFPAVWTNLAGDRSPEQESVQLRSPSQGQGVAERQNKRTPEQSNLLRARLIILQAPRGVADDPIPLGVSLDGVAGNAILVISGLPTGSTISAGRPSGDGFWRLAASDVGNATVRPPRGFTGSVSVGVDLQLPDGTIADRQSARLTWTAPAPVVTAPVAVRTTPFAPPPTAPASPGAAGGIASQPRPAATSQAAGTSLRRLDREEVANLLKRGEDLIAAGDIGPARLVLQRAAEAGDARAAYSLATTYDPILLETRGVVGVLPDIKLARTWYEKAQQLGSTEASRRLELLASRQR